MSGHPLWDFNNPGRCDVAEVEHYADVLADRIQRLERVAVRVEQAATSTEAGGFVASAGQIWRAAIRAMVPLTVNTVTGELAKIESASRAYARDVSNVQTSTAHAIALRDEAHQLRVAFEATDPHYQSSPDGRAKYQTLHDMEDEVQRRFTQLISQRQSADARYAAALKDLPSVAGIDEHSLEVVGSAMPERATIEDAVAALAVLDAIAATNDLDGDPTNGDKIAALQAALARLGDDPDAWSAYFEEIGGEKTIKVVNELAANNTMPYDETNYAAAAEVAGLLRHGLSVASETWDNARGREFAQEMIDGSNSRTFAEISFFFSDPHGDVMGRSLTVAMATDMDEMERVDGDLRFGLDNGNEDSVMRFIETLAGPGELMSRDVYGDASAMIFQSLGEYPDSALNFLISGPDGPDGVTARMQYWFHDRDSSDSFFLGPISLLEGVEHATGGILDSGDYRDYVWESTAKIMHDGFMLLTDEESQYRIPLVGELLPWVDTTYADVGQGDGSQLGVNDLYGSGEGSSPRSSGTRAGPRELHADARRRHAVEPAGGDAAWVRNHMFGLGDDENGVPIANISREELGKMIRVIASDPQAIATLDQAVEAYQGHIFNAMDAAGAGLAGQPWISGTDGLMRIAGTEALVDAVVAGRVEEISLEQVDNMNDAFSWGNWIVGNIKGGDGVAAGIEVSGKLFDEAIRADISTIGDLEPEIAKDNFMFRIGPVIDAGHWQYVGGDDFADPKPAARGQYGDIYKLIKNAVYGDGDS